MKRFLINIFVLLFLLNGFQLQHCRQLDGNEKRNAYNQISIQQIDYADSILILYTLREWGKLNWWTFEDYSKMYKIDNKDVMYFISRVFYDSKKLKIIVWYGDKVYNAPTIESYTDNLSDNRICPKGGDTIYSMNALIGFRDSLHQVWNFYPFDNQSVACSPDKETAINIMEQYYFEKMKDHKMNMIMQGGNRKGQFELRTYGYNLQDKDFWSNCWIWQKDTVGSYGLYPFQIKAYNYFGNKCDATSAEPYNPPSINYPEEILRHYKLQRNQ